MNKTLLQAIIAFILGQKYYINIFNRKGTPMVEVSSFIFASKAAAQEHRKEMESSASFAYVETITFRSRYAYKLSAFQNIKTTILTDK